MADSTFDIESLKNKVNDLQAYLGIGGAKPATDKPAQPAPTPALGTAENPAPLNNIPTPTQTQPPVNNSMQGQMPSTDLVKLQETDTTSGLANDKEKQVLKDSASRQSNAYSDLETSIKNQSTATNKANQAADTQLGSMQDKATEYADAVNKHRAELKSDLSELDNQIQKVKDTQYKDFWADKSTGGKIAMAIAVGVGQYAATMTGTQNMSWNILQKAMDDDFRLQQANFDKQLKSIDMLKLGMDQKQKLVDTASKDFEVYKIARASFIEDSINKEIAKTGKQITPALQEALTRTTAAKEAAYQNTMMNLVDKKSNQVVSAIRQPQITPDLADKMATNPSTGIGRYNKAVDDYGRIQSLKGSKNYNGIVIDLIANAEKQGSFDPKKFDTTTRSLYEKAKDVGLAALGEGDQQLIVKAAEDYFKENVKETYNSAKSQIPLFKSLSMQHSVGQSSNLYIRDLPKGMSDSMTDLSKKGLREAP